MVALVVSSLERRNLYTPASAPVPPVYTPRTTMGGSFIGALSRLFHPRFPPAVTHTADRYVPIFHFGSVVEQIKFDGIALPHEDQEIYRYHTSRRTVQICEGMAIGGTFYAPGDLKIQSVYLRVNNTSRMPDTAFLEIIGKDGQARYAVPCTVQFDGAILGSIKRPNRIKQANSVRDDLPLTEWTTRAIEDSDRDFIDGQLIIISNGSQPYDWDVFYLLESLKEL